MVRHGADVPPAHHSRADTLHPVQAIATRWLKHDNQKANVYDRDWGVLLAAMLFSDLRGAVANFVKGLAVTFRQQHPANLYTEQYPAQRPPVAERYRGAPRLNINPETGDNLCIACDLCAVACPENLIVVGSTRDPKTKHKVLTTFSYDLSRCMFCGLCEDACPVDALELTQDFEMATFSRKGMIWDRQMLEEGPVPETFKH